MFAVLPLLFLVLLSLVFNRIPISKSGPFGWRVSFILSSVVWGLVIVIITEVLSLFSAVSFMPLLIVWAFLDIVLVWYFSKRGGFSSRIPRFHLSRFEIVMLSFIGFIILVTLVIALIAPPNNWDASTYHMARVAHWAQNKSVAYYPTHIIRQLCYSPGAEFIVLNFQVLAGSDRFANLAQWVSMFGCLIGASLIAKFLGANRIIQIFASLICAAVPMGILQSSSAQSDYAVSFWLVSFVCLGLLSFVKNSRVFIPACGIALGLAWFTKGSAYLYSLPFLIWFLVKWFKKYRLKGWKPLVIVFVLALSVNSGYITRNYKLFHKPFFAGEYPIYNSPLTFRTFLSGVSKNVSLHLGTPFHSINKAVYSALLKFHKLIGVDINDRALDFKDRPFSLPGLSFNEDIAGNFLHIILVFISILIWAAVKRVRKKPLNGYLLASLSGFLLLCWIVKWQEWGTRYHLPFFVLFSPVIASIQGKVLKQKTLKALFLVIFIFCSPWVLFNQTRPLISKNISILNTPRAKLYFVNFPYLEKPYNKAVDFIAQKGYRKIGLVLGEDEWDDWEYPLWVLLKDRDKGSEIRHIDIKNISKALTRSFSPDAIVCITRVSGLSKVYKYTALMKHIKSFGPVSVLTGPKIKYPAGK